MSIRIGIITQGVSSVVRPLLNHPAVEIVALVESIKIPVERLSTAGKLQRLLASMQSRERNLARFANQQQIPFCTLHSENIHTFEPWLEERNCDLVIVWSMAQLLPSSTITIPRLGMLNMHPTLLPAYRGPNPLFWLYHDGVTESGTSLHFIDPGEDTGDIVLQQKYSIPPGICLREFQQLAMATHGVSLVIEAIERVNNNQPLFRQIQPVSSPTRRARRIQPDEYQSLIDWDIWPTERIWHFLRGTNALTWCVPPPPYSRLGYHWVVLTSDKTHPKPANARGQITKDSKGYALTCRDGLIRLEKRFSTMALAKSIYHLLRG